MNASLIAAALVARDARYAVRVILPRPEQQVIEATEAAEQAGVDLAVQRTPDGATVHFVARHQDRRICDGGHTLVACTLPCSVLSTLT